MMDRVLAAVAATIMSALGLIGLIFGVNDGSILDLVLGTGFLVAALIIVRHAWRREPADRP